MFTIFPSLLSFLLGGLSFTCLPYFSSHPLINLSFPLCQNRIPTFRLCLFCPLMYLFDIWLTSPKNNFSYGIQIIPCDSSSTSFTYKPVYRVLQEMHFYNSNTQKTSVTLRLLFVTCSFPFCRFCQHLLLYLSTKLWERV